MLNLKSPIILATCLLLLSSLTLQTYANYNPDECCFKFISKPINPIRVALIRPTDSMCPMEGVIIQVKKGYKYCADPSVQWVKNLIAIKGLNKGVNTTASTPSKTSQPQTLTTH